MNLRRRTAKGITWAFVSQIASLLITLVVTVVLARLLSPTDFGLVAMVAVFSSFFALFNDMGLSAAIIHKRDVTEEDLSSAFWVNLLEGLAVTVVFLVLAPVIAGFYSKNILKPIVMVLSMTFIISSLGMIQSALFAKQMDFRTLAIVEIVSVALAGGVAITLAAAGLGVWSIVSYSLVRALVLATLLFVFSGWKPKLLLRWKPIKVLLRYSLPLMGFGIVNYFYSNLDNLLIGKYLGASQLGYYDIAYRSLLLPLSNVSNVIGRVMFPALSHLEDDKARVRAAYIVATRYIAVITFPLMVGLAVLAPQLVRALLGAKWERAIFLMQILALAGGLMSLVTTVGWIYLSQGRTRVLFVVGTIFAAVFAGGFIAGLHWDVEGVAVAYAIAVALLIYPNFAIPFRFIDMKFWYYAKQFWTIAIATFGMGVVMIGLRFIFERVIGIGDVPILVVLVIVGATCYFGLLRLVDRELLRDLMVVFREIKANAPSPEGSP